MAIVEVRTMHNNTDETILHYMHILLTLSCHSGHSWGPYNAQQYWWNNLFLTTVWSELSSDINLFALQLKFLMPLKTIPYLLIVLSTFSRNIRTIYLKMWISIIVVYTNSLLFDPLNNASWCAFLLSFWSGAIVPINNSFGIHYE